MKKGFMKKVGAIAVALAAVTMCGTSVAQAATWMPPLGPLYIKFDNKEQLNLAGPEVNWGVALISTVSAGNNGSDPYNFPPTGNPLWTDGDGNAEITAMFYGLTAGTPSATAFNSTGGFIDLYYDDTPDADMAAASAADRTGVSSFNNFTDGVLLARIAFYNGAIIAGDLVTSVTGTAIPTAGGFTGFANSFGNVVDVNGDGIVDELDGAWADILDGNYFPVQNGLANADLKFRNIYESTGSHSWDDLGRQIFGADSTDPARAYVVPEPSTMLLLGMGLVGAGLMARRRKA